MRPLLAAAVLVGLAVGIADAADDPITVTLKNDERLVNRTGEKPKRIGILTYYPNMGGGYTFLEHEQIVFYSLPYVSTTYKAAEYMEAVAVRDNNGKEALHFHYITVVLGTIGPSTMPYGGQTVYRSEMKGKHPRECPSQPRGYPYCQMDSRYGRR
jgi:hypothetical protein